MCKQNLNDGHFVSSPSVYNVQIILHDFDPCVVCILVFKTIFREAGKFEPLFQILGSGSGSAARIHYFLQPRILDPVNSIADIPNHSLLEEIRYLFKPRIRQKVWGCRSGGCIYPSKCVISMSGYVNRIHEN